MIAVGLPAPAGACPHFWASAECVDGGLVELTWNNADFRPDPRFSCCTTVAIQELDCQTGNPVGSPIALSCASGRALVVQANSGSSKWQVVAAGMKGAQPITQSATTSCVGSCE